MAKTEELTNQNGELCGEWLIYCLGCKMHHSLNCKEGGWTFNGDVNNPTFAPSLLVRFNWGENREPKRCHSFIRNGNMEYLTDCTHELAGTTVELPEIEE